MIAEALRYADDPNAPRVEGHGRQRGRRAPRERDLGRAGPPGPDDRRLLHDPVRRRGRPADRPRRSCSAATRSPARTASTILADNTLFNLPDPDALGLDHALFGSGFFAYLGAVFFALGATAFKFLVPALAGYIAYAIADRPGIAPGFVDGRDRHRPRWLRHPAERLPRRHHRRRPRRRARALDRQLEGPGLGARPDAGAGHPAARDADLRLRHDRRARQAAGQPDGGPQQTG